jgi:DNA helicase II / ATP-dependent DNA helicase PcrA
MAKRAFRWNDQLQGPHLRVAASAASPLRVLAGPGTGKTYALMRRIARLLQSDAVPHRILVCTFTRTAATDLRNSLAALGVDGVDQVRAGTLHSLCFSILSRADVLTLTDRVPRPLLTFEERFLIEDLRGIEFGGVRECEAQIAAFAAAWARLQHEDPGWPVTAVDRRFHTALLGWLRFHRAMLIGEVVPELLGYLRQNPAAPEHGLFQHVLVDEFQDLNRAEQVVFDLLAARGRLTIVGDEDQSIYSFKHANPEGIRNFADSHAGTHDEQLLECRRCPHAVVAIATALIAHNQRGPRGPLQAHADNPAGDVYIAQWRNIQEEAAGVAAFIQRRIDDDGIEAGQVLVLAPRRQFGYAIRDALTALEVPAHSFFHEQAFDGSPMHLERSQAQQAYTLLNLLADPDDHVSLRCWCGFGGSTLRAGAWRRLRHHCEETGQGLRTALESFIDDAPAQWAAQLGARYQELIETLRPLDDLEGRALLDALFPAGQSWAEPFRAAEVSLTGEDYAADRLRDVLRNHVTQPELPTDVEYVRIMSLHKSKGLTADLVVVVGCIDGLIPGLPDAGTVAERRRALEEQRRLFYVALTRTRRILLMSSVTHLSVGDAAQMRARTNAVGRTIASRFLAELGPEAPVAVNGTELP